MTATLLLSSPLSARAEPTNAAIQAKQAEAAQIQSQLDEMNADLEEQVEEYNAVTEALDATRLKITETEAELAAAELELAGSREVLARRVNGMYRRGAIDPVGVLLGTASFQDFLNRMDLLRRISRRDAEAVAAVRQAKARIEAAEKALESREAELVVLRENEKVKKEAIERKIAEREKYLAAVNADVKRLIDEERKRQEAAAAEAARRAAASARGGTYVFDPSKLRGGHPEVVAIAQQYLGVPYVWGGASPSGFDCSGLMWYCYRQIGIALPRTSRSQFRAGQHIPPDRLDLLLPGDLVFFGRNGNPDRVHHVGMYVTNGTFIHAPNTGDVVKFASLTDRIASKHDYVGASRF
ncbi:MAG: hypothetical protein FDZ70_02065 [Actinobacteria bacterium]|nr:MAG: hypothetical protein FDZ70_02065 [Actinomycetota bacterium]